eukprot:TRINITY_DN3890_c0_g1_i6.p1 TRINITY_DN3890_c0_g1~~TRINITY_DN3890_c0_g1_i6.p1  ORF type:complete len:794 (+),score=101.37 TRINITY_DN3890_c0_g1_i6:71-2383(+)
MAATHQGIGLLQPYQPTSGQGFQSVRTPLAVPYGQVQYKQTYPTPIFGRVASLPATFVQQAHPVQRHQSVRLQATPISPSSPVRLHAAQPSFPLFQPTYKSVSIVSSPTYNGGAQLSTVKIVGSHESCGGDRSARLQQPIVQQAHPVRPQSRPVATLQPSSPLLQEYQQQMLTPLAQSREGTPADVLNTLVSVLQGNQELASFARSFFERKDIHRRGLLSFDDSRAALSDIYASLRSKFDTPEQILINRMNKRNIDGKGQLDCEGFTDVCRWCLWHKYQQLVDERFCRAGIVGRVHRGVPSQFYRIGKKLGEGSFGIVHEATSFSSGNVRVMKTINKSRCVRNGLPLELIESEIDILASLDHPHVLRMFEHYRDSQNFYMILEECKGGELMDVFKAEQSGGIAVPEAWLAKVFRQVLEAIAYIHGKGVMHKDLKFENVMLRDRDAGCFDLAKVRAVIIDVGLAELFGSNHGRGDRSTLVAGTLDTMAPEVLARNFSYKCDIWSIGCMLFAIFNRNPTWVGTEPQAYPFQVTNPPEAMRELQARGPPMHLLAGASVGVQDAIRRMLSFNEAARPSAAQCLMLPWLAGNVENNMIQFSQGHAHALTSPIHATLWSQRVLLEAALELPASSIQKLEELFDSVDLDHTGVLSEEEVFKALVNAGVPHQAAVDTAKQLSCNGGMEFSTFVATILPSCKEIFCQSLQSAFQKFDTNHDGVLDANEVLQLLSYGEIHSRHLPNNRVVEMMMQRMHGSAKGGITFSEFQEYFLSQTED